MKIIGIIVRIEYLDHAWKYFTNESYLNACQTYGWQPILLCSLHDPKRITAMCDALLIPGGYDIASHYFQQAHHKESKTYAKGMDHLDFLIIDAFVKAKKPILGICRGMQILNVYFGGTLCQHFEPSTHEESEHQHLIHPNQQTIFTQLLHPNQYVNSYHHQCVEQLADNLIVGATSPDHIIEAFTHAYLPIIAVQWHPEGLENDQVLPYFFDVLTRS